MSVDKLIDIKNTFEDIRDAIGRKGVTVDQCDSPTTYASKILRITGDETTLPLLFDATYEEGKEVAVEYNVNEKGTGVFHFTLARGPKGENGKDGTSGSDGSDGKDGKDGKEIQFIFGRTNGKTPEKPISNATSDSAPESKDGVTWYTYPQGVTDDHTYEGVCTREKNPTSKQWGSYTNPVIGAQWGKVGKDGNGIEYIFCLTQKEDDVPNVPNSDPDKGEDKIESWPLKAGEYMGYDDPQTVTQENRYCGVSIRKQSTKKENGVDVQKGGPYSSAALGSKYSIDGIDGGGRTVFAYCTGNETPKKPTGGSWNPKTNTITAPTASEGDRLTGYIYPIEPNEEFPYIYQSNASFDSNGNIQGEGSDPVRITGKDGVNGADGTSVQFIYRLIPNKFNFDLLSEWHLDEANNLKSDPTGKETAPDKTDKVSNYKEGGNKVSADGNTQYGTICDTNGTDEPRGIDGNDYLIECACTRTKTSIVDATTNESKEEWGPGSKPFLGAVGGEDGKDGTGVEYIYVVTAKKGVFIENGQEITREITADDIMLPTLQDYKEYDGINNKEYSTLFQKPGFIPGKTDDNIFEIFYSADNAGWTDEPREVGPDQPLEGVAIRKRQIVDGEYTGSGGDFSRPVVGNQGVTDGTSFKTAFAFTRSDKPLTEGTVDGQQYIPEGGSYQKPVPNDAIVGFGPQDQKTITWGDTVPSGTGQIGMTTRLFKANNLDEGADGDWSVPTLMADSSMMQIEFAQVYKDASGEHEDRIPDPVNFQSYYDNANGDNEVDKLENAEVEGRKFEKDKGGIGSDGNDISNPMGMAVCYKRNNKWTDGTVTRVKGERGTAGENGTSVTILGSAKRVECAFNSGEKQTLNSGADAKYILQQCENSITLYEGSNDETAYVVKQNHNNGDGYLIDQDLGVGDGDSFENVGQIKGDPGNNAHLYIAFSDDPRVEEKNQSIDVSLTAKTGKYIGYLTSSYEVDEEALKKSATYTYWTKWTGDDGWGHEQIFLLTKEVHNEDLVIDYDNGPRVPEEEDDDNTPEYLPNVADIYKEYSYSEKGLDAPLSPTQEYPYCGVAHRSTSDGKWKGEWVYNEAEPDNSYYKAVLYTRHVPDLGYLELDNDNLVVPLDNGSIDADFTAKIKLTFYYAGSTVSNLTGYYYRFDENKNWDQISTGELTIDNSSELGDCIYFKATYNDVDYYKNCTIRKVDNAYRLQIDSTIIHKDATYNPGTITCSVQKGNANKWEDSTGTPIYYKVDDGVEKEYNNGFDCSIEQPQKHVRFYIKESDKILDFEDVAVVTDGRSAYHLQLSEDHVTVPLIASGEIDSDYLGFDITATLYAGDVALDEDEGVKYAYKFRESDPATETKDNSAIIAIKSDSLTGKPDKLTIIVTRGSSEGSKDVKIDYASIAYEMIVSKNIIRRDASTNKIVDTDSNINVTIMRGSGTEWSPAKDITVFADAWNVEDQPINIGAMSTDPNGIATFEGFNTDSFKGLAGLKFYIKDNNDAEIAHENVGVVVNGEDGAWQEFIYRVFDSKQTSIDNPTPMENGNIDYNTEVKGKKYSDPEYVPEYGMDDPEDLTKDGQYQYVSVRKKVNNQWQAFSTPVIWSYKAVDGKDGQDAVSITFGSSPTILLDNNNRPTIEDLYVSMGAMQGSNVKIIEGINDVSATFNGSNINTINVAYEDDFLKVNGFSDINTTGTIYLSFDVIIDGVYDPIQTSLTIVVQQSGGQSAKHISLSEDSVTVFKDEETMISTEATFYDGGESKAVDWYVNNFKGHYASYTYELTESFTESTAINIQAQYNNTGYTKVFRVNVVDTEDRYGLTLDKDVVNISNNEDHSIDITVGNQSKNESAKKLTTLPDNFVIEFNGTPLSYSNGASIIINRTEHFIYKTLTVQLKQDSYIGDAETITINRDPVVYSLTAASEVVLSNDEYIGRIKVEYIITEGDLTPPDSVLTPIIKYSKNNESEKEYIEPLEVKISENGDKYVFNAYVSDQLKATTSLFLQQPVQGPPGESGVAPVIYPAGEYDKNTTYTSTSYKAPFVYVKGTDSNQYYIAYGSGNGVTPQNNILSNPDWNNVPTNELQGVPMDKYNAIYSDIGMFNTALVGKWVFFKDYMFSQDGIVGFDGGDDYGFEIGSQMNYEKLLKIKKFEEDITEAGEDDPVIGTPNIGFDAKSGKGWFAGGKITFEGNTATIGGLTVTENGLSYGQTLKIANDGIVLGDINSPVFAGRNERIALGYKYHSINIPNGSPAQTESLEFQGDGKYNGLAFYGKGNVQEGYRYEYKINMEGTNLTSGEIFNMINTTNVPINIFFDNSTVVYYKAMEVDGENPVKLEAGQSAQCMLINGNYYVIH